MSLAEIQKPPNNGLILLTGAPGAGKSTFCHQVVIRSIAADRPVIFVTSEQSPAEVVELLGDTSQGDSAGPRFVDAFTETVGLASPPRSDTVYANCADLNSLSIAITTQRERMGTRGTLLVFDSLTSPYLFSGREVVKFMRLFLSRFAAEGNAVLALIDEGCSREEDMVAMQSIAHGILRMEVKDSSRVINVVKYPKVQPTVVEVPPTGIRDKGIWDRKAWSREVIEGTSAMMRGKPAQSLDRKMGNHVSLFWPNLAFWSSMLWDPEGFAQMAYEVNKKHSASIRQSFSLFPWYMRILLRFFIPKSFSSPKDVRKLIRVGRNWEQEHCGMLEYREDISKAGEYHVRVYESYECSGFENVGTTMASFLPPLAAGMCKGLEKVEREWNAVETKCIGLGDPYCELKLVPGEIGGLMDSVRKDSLVVEKIQERLLERVMGFLLQGKPLVERPRLGGEIHVDTVGSVMAVPTMSGERRYQTGWRMGGVNAGKRIGERLLEAGLSGDEAVERVLDFMSFCKVGKIAMGEAAGGRKIRIDENCESFWVTPYMVKWDEPRCFFTTGFLNGLFSAAKNQHAREVKCIAAGEPYCEWEIA